MGHEAIACPKRAPGTAETLTFLRHFATCFRPVPYALFPMSVLTRHAPPALRVTPRIPMRSLAPARGEMELFVALALPFTTERTATDAVTMRDIWRGRSTAVHSRHARMPEASPCPIAAIQPRSTTSIYVGFHSHLLLFYVQGRYPFGLLLDHPWQLETSCCPVGVFKFSRWQTPPAPRLSAIPSACPKCRFVQGSNSPEILPKT